MRYSNSTWTQRARLLNHNVRHRYFMGADISVGRAWLFVPHIQNTKASFWSCQFLVLSTTLLGHVPYSREKNKCFHQPILSRAETSIATSVTCDAQQRVCTLNNRAQRWEASSSLLTLSLRWSLHLRVMYTLQIASTPGDRWKSFWEITVQEEWEELRAADRSRQK